ncbi:MAG: hypothetical protein JNJ83_10480 [Verrucomicrobiaceae bacterium]|nr:hypothetical protein [Verrucomicrobiaceae bacterium]
MKRKPHFCLSLRLALEKVRMDGRRDICAAQVVVLNWLMEKKNLSICGLAAASHVPRQTIADLLELKSYPMQDTIDRVAEGICIKHSKLVALAEKLLEGAMPVLRHGQT